MNTRQQCDADKSVTDLQLLDLLLQLSHDALFILQFGLKLSQLTFLSGRHKSKPGQKQVLDQLQKCQNQH